MESSSKGHNVELFTLGAKRVLDIEQEARSTYPDNYVKRRRHFEAELGMAIFENVDYMTAEYMRQALYPEANYQ